MDMRKAIGRLPAPTLTLALLLAVPVTMWAQEAPVEADRPRLGLVLAGGGARGLAHVGVIRWLEEHRIPVDLVAGTSMGGLVGGIYATGTDVPEMREFLDSIDWPRVLAGHVPYEQKAFRRREDKRFAPAELELGLKDGLSWPPGLDAGQQVGLVLDRISLPYSGIASFDELPIPFACVAIDLAAGDEVVFREGRLGLALRSTMSFPAWFSPVRDGDRVLADGGALNNMPTDVMASMGADLIVAVDLGARSSVEEVFDSALGAVNRSVSIMMRKRTDQSADLADILITPDVSEFGLMSFEGQEALERIGYEAAAEHAEALLAHAVDEETWQAYVTQRASRRRELGFVPRFVEVSGGVRSDDDRVAEMLGHHVDVPLDLEQLDYDLTRITGRGRYEVAGYERRDADDGPGLAIRLVPKTYGPPFLRPIFNIVGTEFGEATVEIGARLTFWDIAGTGSEWRNDLLYGRTAGVRTELYVPVGVGGLFVAPRARVGETRSKLYGEGEATAEYETRVAGGGFDLGYIFSLGSELRVGVDYEHQEAVIAVGSREIDPLEGPAGSVHARWRLDQVDSALIPTSGVRATLGGRWVFDSPGAEERFYQAQGRLVGAGRLAPRISLLAAIEGGTTFDRTAPPLDQFLVGGPLRLGALGQDELRGSRYVLGQAGVLWALSDPREFSFLGRFYLLGLYEFGDAFEDRAQLFHSATAGIAGETRLGAVFFGGAIGEGGRSGFFFTLGRLF